MKKIIQLSFYLIIISIFSILFFACKDENKVDKNENDTQPKKAVNVPIFNADTAFNYIEKQLSFGFRNPGSKGQTQCAAWLKTEFEKYADTVYIQKTNVIQAVSKKTYPAINIIAAFNPQATDRILLLAHWDSRPWADEDSKDKDKPILAADDAGSGVAVLLEIARHLKTQKPNLGIDILLVDAEDVGRSEWSEESYCLGTQHWAKNPHVPNYKAKFGICLDMVGAKGAQFPLETFSQNYAPNVQRKVWDIANRIGYSDYFRYVQGGAITDDHVVVNELAKIPCIDIINLQPNGSFGSHWHTHNDNLEIIDKNVLKAVGQTVLHVVYEEE